jgi:hypothetical protein
MSRNHASSSIGGLLCSCALPFGVSALKSGYRNRFGFQPHRVIEYQVIAVPQPWYSRIPVAAPLGTASI